MIYFDNAATGFPKDKDVIKSIVKAFYECGNPGRSGHIYSMRGSEKLFLAREALADFFGTLPENVILCGSATNALNIAIKGLFVPGKKIIISDMEHNSVIRPSFAIGETISFTVDIDDDENTIKEFEKKIKDDVCLAVVTHASNICGRILPVQKMAEICKRLKIPIIVDASQTAGYIPINLSKSDIDVLCIPGHKGIYGPMGTGALIVNKKSDLHFKTILEGGTGMLSSETNMPDILPERLEAGTLAVHDYAGLETAVRKCKLNLDPIIEMYLYILNHLKSNDKITVYGYSLKNTNKYMPVILFNCKSITPIKLSEALSEKGICTRSGFHCSPTAHQKLNTGQFGAVRVSIGKKNTMNECKTFVKTLKNIIK